MSTHHPPHLGEILREWLAEVTVTDTVLTLGIIRAMLSCVLNGVAAISDELDVHLSKSLSTSPGFWYAQQSEYDL